MVVQTNHRFPRFAPNFGIFCIIDPDHDFIHRGSTQIRRPFKQFDGQEEIDNRKVRATYRDLLTVGGARAWAGRRIRG